MGKPNSCNRRKSCTTVYIDADRVHEFFRKQRITLSSASELVGRCSGWLHACMHQGRMSYYAIDDLASEFGVTTDELAYRFASDEEREFIDSK